MDQKGINAPGVSKLHLGVAFSSRGVHYLTEIG